jgi:WhiB family transcriptional regulator, redox-sensing transcriptional regulator
MSKAILKLVIPDAASGNQPPACKNEDPELFFPRSYDNYEYERQVQEAKAVCQRCPMVYDCLQFALETGDKYAILGGSTPNERAGMLHRKAERERGRKAA